MPTRVSSDSNAVFAGADSSSTVTKLQAAEQCFYEQTACLAIRGIDTGDRNIREFGCKGPMQISHTNISDRSWQMAADGCNQTGGLCTKAQLCDGSIGREVVPASWNDATWLPVADSENSWIQYGPGGAEQNQRCKTFEEINGGSAPSWGTNTSAHPWKHTALCCAPAATQYACEAVQPVAPRTTLTQSHYSLSSSALRTLTNPPIMSGTLEAHQVTSTGVTLSWLPAKHEGGSLVSTYRISIRIQLGHWNVLQVPCPIHCLDHTNVCLAEYPVQTHNLPCEAVGPGDSLLLQSTGATHVLRCEA